jgi:hypothetical protein
MPVNHPVKSLIIESMQAKVLSFLNNKIINNGGEYNHQKQLRYYGCYNNLRYIKLQVAAHTSFRSI